ncbi:type IV pilus modification PilV family protein [Natronospora cellulosivora (SeqCode)]
MIKSEKGFTFVEVMLSLVVLTIVFLMLSSSFMNGIGIIRSSQNKREALNTVQSELNRSILRTSGTNRNITLVFREHHEEENAIPIQIPALLIEETAEYSFNNEIRDITLEFYEVIAE